MKRILVSALAVVAIASGCGGGGSDSSTATTAAFPLQAAINSASATGFQKALSVSGSAVSGGTTYPVTGSVQFTESAATSGVTFAGQPALQQNTSILGTITVNGQALTVTSTGQGFSTLAHNVLGATSQTSYCVTSTPGSYPASVTEGMTGTIATLACYTDSTQSVSAGTQVLSYTVSAGPSTSEALLASTSVVYNSANQQIGSVEVDYILSSTGTLTLQSVALTEAASGVSLSISAR
jgi:hypothetical protein